MAVLREFPPFSPDMLVSTDTPPAVSPPSSAAGSIQPAASAVMPARGFKEWSRVCEALGAGAQSLILRKGGIHEGRGGFWWRHDQFFLFSTHFHEQDAQFPWNPPGEEPGVLPLPDSAAASASNSDSDSASETGTAEENGSHTVEFLAKVDFKHQITSWETAARLQAFHFWTEETVRARFDYSEETGISLAFLRIYRLSRPWTFADERKFGGCRSWLDLPVPPADLSWTPVLDDATHAERRAAVQEIPGMEG